MLRPGPGHYAGAVTRPGEILPQIQPNHGPLPSSFPPPPQQLDPRLPGSMDTVRLPPSACRAHSRVWFPEARTAAELRMGWRGLGAARGSSWSESVCNPLALDVPAGVAGAGRGKGPAPPPRVALQLGCLPIHYRRCPRAHPAGPPSRGPRFGMHARPRAPSVLVVAPPAPLVQHPLNVVVASW